MKDRREWVNYGGPANPNYRGVWARRRPQLEAWCAEGLSVKEMAKRFHTSTRHVLPAIRGFGIPYKMWDWKGKKNPAWRGGRIVDKGGYVMLYLPDHPDSNCHGYIREHRLVMEKKLGRRLLKTEVVHHDDGVPKWDNRPEVLHLYQSNAKHLAETLKGKCPHWTPKGQERMVLALSRRDARGKLLPIPRGTKIGDSPAHESIARKIAAHAGAGHVPSETGAPPSPSHAPSAP